MHMNEMTLMQRRNLGNYEHREVTLTMTLKEGDDVQAAYESLNQSLNVALGFAQEVTVAEEKKPEPQETTAPKKQAKKATKKASSKKKETKKEEPVAQPTKEEMLALCRETANRLGDADKVKELINQACGVSSLNEADPQTYNQLKKLLGDA